VDKQEVRGVWEYLVVDINSPGDIASWSLEQVGNDGWDLFEILMFGPGVFPMGKMVFKRYKTVPI